MKRNNLTFTLCLAILAILTGCATTSTAQSADVKPQAAKLALAPIFTDYAVLQRDMVVPVWGTAEPGENVTVVFAGQKVTAKADDSGKWMAKLQPLATSAENRPLTVQGKTETVTINNVMVGEVWMCSGQSNMEMPMWTANARWRNIDGDKYCAEGANKLIRFTRMPKYEWSKLPRTDYPIQWQEMTADNTQGFSAIAFFYGHELQRELQIPIGLVTAYWGGTRIEPWTPPCGFDSVPELSSLARSVNAKLPGTQVYKEIGAQTIAKYDEWLAKFKEQVANNQELTEPPAFPSELVWGSNHQQPTVLYNRMMYPFVPYCFRGALWYQGCSNLGEGMLYKLKMQALFNGWKKVFMNPDMKLYFVQLAPYNYGGDPSRLPGMWEAQQAFAEENAPAVGMAVINDVGNLGDIHPHDKLTVSKRLAAMALQRTYGRNVKADSPVLTNYAIDNGKFVLTFKNVESWKTKNNEAIKNFEVAGVNGVFVPAFATIDGARLVVSSVNCPDPRKVRYMWHQLNEGNLFNEAGFPLGAFRAGKDSTLDDVKALLDKEQKLVYEMDLMKPVPYVKDNSADIKDFKRVTYLVEAIKKDGAKQWLAVGMDAFTGNVKQIGLPIDFIQAKQVDNLVVLSNVAGINVGPFGKGNIEFWPGNYGQQNNFNVPGANARTYDFGDSTEGLAQGYGSMQVHLFQQRQTLFAFNRFHTGLSADFGIGNNTGNENPDYTFMQNLGRDYTAAKISVFVK